MNQRWKQITPSDYAWERDALAWLREHLPDHEPYRAWANFEFIALDGSINEVDLLVVTPKGCFLVEIKSRPGEITGNAGTWHWTHQNRCRVIDNPRILAERKAKKLASLLKAQRSVSRGKERLPYIETLVFLSAADLINRLTGPARIGVYQRDRAVTDEQPEHWPDDYRALVEQRIRRIESHRYIDLLERPEYKRRWNQGPWPELQQRALRDWLLDRLEQDYLAADEALTSAARLADRIQLDADFLAVAALYTGDPAFDPRRLVTQLIGGEAVPAMATARYKPRGLEKHRAWQAVWEQQRREDAIDARTRLPNTHPDYLTEKQAAERKRREIGEIPVPPRYTSGDFRQNTFWALRGKLDVPRERFFSLPGAERDGDPSPVIGWAGWDRPQRARAIAGHYLKMKESEGWSAERLLPLLVALAELIPWLKQWHNAVDPNFGERLGDYFDGFLAEDLRALGLSRSRLDEWRPPAGRRARHAARG